MILKGRLGITPFLPCGLTRRSTFSDVEGLGGTNLHEVDWQAILKHNSHIINKLRFAINS